MSHVSCCTVPSPHFTAPAISTKRHTFSQVAPPSADLATALKSGSQFAPHPNNTPSLRFARHASCGAPASGANDAPPSVELYAKPPITDVAVFICVATTMFCASRITTSWIVAPVART